MSCDLTKELVIRHLMMLKIVVLEKIPGKNCLQLLGYCRMRRQRIKKANCIYMFYIYIYLYICNSLCSQ